MLSRHAENLYWLGRYLERADNVARLADANFQANIEQFQADGEEAWDAVIEALGAQEVFAAMRSQRPALDPSEFVVYSVGHPQSVRSTIAQARALARELREYLSREVFEEINRLYLTSMAAATGEQGRRIFTNDVRRMVAATLGLFHHTVVNTEASDWFRCGLYLERADMTSRIIDSKYFVLLPSAAEVGGPIDRYQWSAVLRSASALEAYHKRYREAVTGPRVAELLLFDPGFPRSLIYCVEHLHDHFESAIEGSSSPQTVFPAREIALMGLDLRAASMGGVIETGLHEFLDEFQARLAQVDQALTEHIFNPFTAAPLLSAYQGGTQAQAQGQILGQGWITGQRRSQTSRDV